MLSRLDRKYKKIINDGIMILEAVADGVGLRRQMQRLSEFEIMPQERLSSRRL
jgi:hypothetical protein